MGKAIPEGENSVRIVAKSHRRKHLENRFTCAQNRSARILIRITGARAALPQNCPRSDFMFSLDEYQGNLGNRRGNRETMIN
jgi:hypothetical protein